MQTKSKLFLALGAIPLALSAAALAQVPANTLVVAKVATPPVLDGNVDDPAWATAKPMTVT